MDTNTGKRWERKSPGFNLNPINFGGRTGSGDVSEIFQVSLWAWGRSGLGSEMCQGLSVPLLLMEMGLPVLLSTGKVLCWRSSLLRSQFLCVHGEIKSLSFFLVVQEMSTRMGCSRKILVFEMQLGRVLKTAAEKGKELFQCSPQALLPGLYLQPMWKQLPPNNTSCGTISGHFTEALLKNREFINLRFRDSAS